MAGVSDNVQITGLDKVKLRFRMGLRMDFRRLADDVGALITSQTQQRIKREKKGPDEKAWEPWSPSYAATRGAQHSLLIGGSQGIGLLGSIQHIVKGPGAVEVGSNLKHARAMQHGLNMSIASTHRLVRVPARPYLGVSDKNAKAVVKLVNDFIARAMMGGV